MLTERQTERLVMRQVKAEDAESLFPIWSDPRVTQFMNITTFSHKNEAVNMINYLNELAEQQQALRFSIIEKKSGRIIGSCGYHLLDLKNEKTEIGYELGYPYWRKGYGTEVVKDLIDAAFLELNLHRIEAKVEPNNVNSIRLLEKVNFLYEGTLRESEKSGDTYSDLQLYSLLKTDSR
ncbi:GNAT family N-acetyltransferase [Salipaludibacillus agaradhaerens]|uniref:GNAT family N-acetyltransferase n=1 Tax=Salipaludibacillus agaradhaerens TaxID=76935 RepID=A0A9Q4B3K1_SALAG|nr:GNAT family protein [Salipaludibacillus agaradhaerens]MCR6097687.1 GNAT family N-acetyltransferase [Salipaludibacillus agaradhaerens]MCR6112829.1 GNAT family N-acetyltransferase [Salipaludibacillus agaradhaerens]